VNTFVFLFLDEKKKKALKHVSKMNYNSLNILLFFFASPKKNQKESPEIEYSPISGSSYI